MLTAKILLVTIHVPVTVDIQEMAKYATVREINDFLFVSRSISITLHPSYASIYRYIYLFLIIIIFPQSQPVM